MTLRACECTHICPKPAARDCNAAQKRTPELDPGHELPARERDTVTMGGGGTSVMEAARAQLLKAACRQMASSSSYALIGLILHWLCCKFHLFPLRLRQFEPVIFVPIVFGCACQLLVFILKLLSNSDKSQDS